MRFVAPLVFAFISCASIACATDSGDGETSDDVTVDTGSVEARAQYDANIAFARAYTSRCTPSSGVPRVLVSGYGRFQGNNDNASGRMVELLTGAKYPSSAAAAVGPVSPAAETNVATRRVNLEGVGDVDICGMVLPVFWDLAPILVATEMEAFSPDLVVMNGVATELRAIPIRLELGSSNLATTVDEDGSGILKAFDKVGDGSDAKLIEGAPTNLPSRMSWQSVKSAMTTALTAQSKLSSIGAAIQRVDFGGYPSDWLTYLCNNLIYVINYLASNPGKETRLLEPSVSLGDHDRGIATCLNRDFRATPRVFIHWPDLSAKERPSGVEILKAAIAAQLRASASGDLPTPGYNAIADQ